MRSNDRDAPLPLVIVGGGIAGLSAAWSLVNSLENSGATIGNQTSVPRVVLLESRRTAGGRAGSFADPASGETTDYCQHVAMGCCTNFIDLLNQTGLIDCFTRYESLSFYHPSTGIAAFRPSPWLPAPLHLHAALAGLPYLSRSQKTRIRIGLWKLMRLKESELQDVVAADWLAANYQDAETCQRFWDVILVSALGDVPQRVSMAAARKVVVEGFAAARGASDVWVPNEPLSSIFGQRMVAALVARGVDVRFATAVRAIAAPMDASMRSTGQSQPSSAVDVLLTDGTSIRAHHVVLATAWRAASRLIQTIDTENQPDSTRSWQRDLIQTLDHISASPITGLHLWFDRILTPLPHVAMVGTTAQWLFRQPIRESHPTEHSDSDPGFYHQVVISGRHELSDAPKAQLVQRVVAELRRALPESRDAVLLRSRVVTDPTAVYSVSPELQSRRPGPSTPLPWLHLAGDYVRTGWPATMEGATISGRLAADSILSRLAGANAGVNAGAPPSVHPGLPSGLLSRCLIRRP